ncbi:MAG: hypothetical protein ACRCY4_05855, partial [Brevinema sp.]
RRAVEMLTEQKETLITLSEILLERETLSSSEVIEILGGVEKSKTPILDDFRKRVPARFVKPAEEAKAETSAEVEKPKRKPRTPKPKPEAE